jgi:hypothetical protein
MADVDFKLLANQDFRTFATVAASDVELVPVGQKHSCSWSPRRRTSR